MNHVILIVFWILDRIFNVLNVRVRLFFSQLALNVRVFMCTLSLSVHMNTQIRKECVQTTHSGSFARSGNEDECVQIMVFQFFLILSPSPKFLFPAPLT